MQADTQRQRSTMKRYRAYIEDKPFLDWIISVSVGLTVYLILYVLIFGPKFNLMLLMYITLAVSPNTRTLIQRFSPEHRDVRPFQASQETGVGILALTVSIFGIAAYALSLIINRLNWSIDVMPGMILIMTFGICAVLSGALGYAARRTLTGIWAMRLTAGAWIILTVAAIVLHIVHNTMHL